MKARSAATLDDAQRAELVRLEECMWQEATRFDAGFMSHHLATDFQEFGRSGRCYTREQALQAPRQVIGAVLPLQDLRVEPLGPGVVLLTYLSRTRDADRLVLARRSSIWIQVDGVWRMRFHQGTPV